MARNVLLRWWRGKGAVFTVNGYRCSPVGLNQKKGTSEPPDIFAAPDALASRSLEYK